MIILLIQTDLPLPVDPATSKWGIVVKSAFMVEPVISFPNVTNNPFFIFSGFTLVITSFILTGLTSRFGISTPIVLFPGIGASIRTSFAASANAISLFMLLILLSFVPAGTTTSYCVTVGPT